MGEWIAEKGIATPAQVDEAFSYALAHQTHIGDALVQLGFATREQVEQVLAEQRTSFNTLATILPP